MRPFAVLSLLLVLLLTACTSDATAGVPDGSAGSGDRVSLDFTAETVSGDAFDAKTLAGKPTVVWFWAPWCPTCRSQISGVSALAEEHKNTVNVVGVGSLDDSAAIAAFAEQVSPDVLQLADPDGTVWRHFGVTAQSTYLVLDAHGNEVAKGSLDDSQLADVVDQLT